MRPTNDELRAMFGSAPASFSSAMEDALQAAYLPDEKEVRPVKKFPRAVLIAAIMLAAMMTVAYAVEAHRGILDYLLGTKANVQLPAAAQEQMQQSEANQVQLGPVVFTLTESLCDQHSLLTTWVASLADGSPAVFVPMGYIPDDPMSADACAQYGVADGTRFAEAARELGLPLYYVSARTQPRVSDVESMLAYLCEGRGSISLISLNMLLGPEAKQAAELTADTLLRVEEYDPATGEAIEGRSWRQEGETLTIPVQGVTATRRYAPQASAEVGGFAVVEAVEAEQTCLGVYLTLALRLNPGADADACWSAQQEFTWLDAQGQPFPEGLVLSTYWSEQMPLMTGRFMLGLETFPEALTLTWPGAETGVKLQ